MFSSLHETRPYFLVRYIADSFHTKKSTGVNQHLNT
nr:MAG TPA: hypothetical protein [Bacteriophage sp.]DAX87131.1 MAG TPA: hypothetical protein [Caudoviricetes sp.]